MVEHEENTWWRGAGHGFKRAVFALPLELRAAKGWGLSSDSLFFLGQLADILTVLSVICTLSKDLGIMIWSLADTPLRG